MTNLQFVNCKKLHCLTASCASLAGFVVHTICNWIPDCTPSHPSWRDCKQTKRCFYMREIYYLDFRSSTSKNARFVIVDER